MASSSEESSTKPINRSRTIPNIDESAFRTDRPEFNSQIQGKNLSLAEVQGLKQAIKDLARGQMLRSTFTCKGQDCISAHSCPFLRINRPDLLPLDMKCPVDIMMAEEYFRERGLIDD